MRAAILLLVLLLPCRASGQTVQPVPSSASAPRGQYLYELTRAWAEASALGDLATRDFAPGDLELRYWGGYGVTGTRGVVIRREGGRWKGWRLRIVTCRVTVPYAVADTISGPTVQRYAADARRKCTDDAPAAGRAIEAELVELVPLKSRLLAAAWQAAMEAGAPVLPPSIERDRAVLDGYTHVLELRIGKSYRASLIDCALPPERPDDYRVQEVAGALARVAPEAGIGCAR